MKHVLFAVSLGAFAFCSCAAGVDDAEQNDDEVPFESSSAALTEWDPAPDPAMWRMTENMSLDVWGCRFTVITAEFYLSSPPRYTVYIRKGQVPGNGCKNTGYRIVHQTFSVPKVDLVRHPVLPALVLGVAAFPLPGSTYFGYVSIQQLSFRDLVSIRTSTLRTEPRPLEEGPSSIYSGDLQLDLFGNLTVTGTFDGTISGMTGVGNNYRAVYRRYLFTPSREPEPTSVVAF